MPFKKFKKYYEPDVFRAAGKRIRALSRATDSLTIDERIERITAIFGKFRNPDKETVLTPWRVVNMHIGNCLGGYVFFDDKFENTTLAPRYIEQDEVTERMLAYWIFTYGIIRLSDDKQLILLSYLLESAFLLNEYNKGSMKKNNVYFCALSCLFIMFFIDF